MNNLEIADYLENTARQLRLAGDVQDQTDRVRGVVSDITTRCINKMQAYKHYTQTKGIQYDVSV